jgi:hypothetical protein
MRFRIRDLSGGRAHRLTVLTLASLVCLQLTGCIYSREIAHVRRDIERAYPGTEFDRQIVLSFGPGFLGAIGWLAEKIDDGDAQRVADYAREIRRVKVGVYRTVTLASEETMRIESLDLFRENGWLVAARVREDDEVIWALYRERCGAVRDIFVLSLSDEELVIVRIEGELDRLLEKILEDELYAGHVLR